MRMLTDEMISEYSDIASEVNAFYLQTSQKWFCDFQADYPEKMWIYWLDDHGGHEIAMGVSPEFAKYIVKLHNIFWALYRMWSTALQVRSWNPRAWKLASNRQNFWVVADDEAYYMAVGGVIRADQKSKGTWTHMDEAYFNAEAERIAARNRKRSKDGMDSSGKARSKKR